MMVMNKEFLRVEDVQGILEIKKDTAYAVIRKLNQQLKDKGYEIVRGRINKRYFLEKYNLVWEE